MPHPPPRRAGPADRARRGGARLVAGLLAGSAALAPRPATGSPADTDRPLPARLYGVTVDDIAQLRPVLAGLRALPRRPTTRVVFDEHVAPGAYAHALDQLRPHSYLLGQPFDSSQLRAASVAGYHARFATYLRVLGGKVDIWEVGNEVNGNWTGPYPSVGAKVTDATAQVAAAGGRSALTVWYNAGCGNGPDELDPVPWSKRYLSAATRAKLDYLLVSYYEDQCGFRRPGAAAWTSYFRQLRALYPNARIGFGELGSVEPVSTAAGRARAAVLVRHYYTLPIDLPYYALGGFYWNYVQDMSPHQGNPLWSALGAAWTAGPNRPPPVSPGTSWADSAVRAAWRREFEGHGRMAIGPATGAALPPGSPQPARTWLRPWSLAR